MKSYRRELKVRAGRWCRGWSSPSVGALEIHLVPVRLSMHFCWLIIIHPIGRFFLDVLTWYFFFLFLKRIVLLLFILKLVFKFWPSYASYRIVLWICPSLFHFVSSVVIIGTVVVVNARLCFISKKRLIMLFGRSLAGLLFFVWQIRFLCWARLLQTVVEHIPVQFRYYHYNSWAHRITYLLLLFCQEINIHTEYSRVCNVLSHCFNTRIPFLIRFLNKSILHALGCCFARAHPWIDHTRQQLIPFVPTIFWKRTKMF